MKMKAYVSGCSMKDAKNYFEGQNVLQGMLNGKKAVYVSAGYDINVAVYEMFSAAASNRYIGKFIPSELIKMEEAVGRVMVAQ